MKVTLSKEMVECLKRAKYVQGLSSEEDALRRAFALLDITSDLVIKGQEIVFVRKGTEVIKGRLIGL